MNLTRQFAPDQRPNRRRESSFSGDFGEGSITLSFQGVGGGISSREVPPGKRCYRCWLRQWPGCFLSHGAPCPLLLLLAFPSFALTIKTSISRNDAVPYEVVGTNMGAKDGNMYHSRSGLLLPSPATHLESPDSAPTTRQ
ncbi:hypothetical protein LX36DRAFT_236993 [Colletotrichum falcatum]|nr:hypothetical protein LX36DRAFT_236993 [Colletotrichum falcatum]